MTLNKTANELISDMFNSATESVRENVRLTHSYGCRLCGKDNTILRRAPKFWSAKAQARLKKEFVKAIMLSATVIADRNQLDEAFEELVYG